MQTLHSLKDREDHSYLKHFMLRLISKLYTASDGVTVFHDFDGSQRIVVPLLEALISTCQSGQLHLICLALDCFYEVFNEDYFD